MGFLNASDAPEPAVSPEAARWCVLLVDDEPEVHSVTQLALRGFEFNGRKLELVSAYSAAQARDIFLTRNDIALAMVDVVMETDHAGLDLVRHVRQDRRNALTRLVLRTGQPGQAPEDQVIRDYDIDDYKEKNRADHAQVAHAVVFHAARV
jgi:CheY-like chemotaxis protein